MPDVRDHLHPPTPKGLHDVGGVFVGSGTREVCRCDDGVRLHGSSMKVHEFNTGFASDKPFVGPQAGWESLDEGFRGGVERDARDGEFRGERTVEYDENRTGEGGLAEGREESPGKERWEQSVPPDHSEVIIFGPLLKSDGFIQYQYRSDYEGSRLTVLPRGRSHQRCL